MQYNASQFIYALGQFVWAIPLLLCTSQYIFSNAYTAICKSTDFMFFFSSCIDNYQLEVSLGKKAFVQERLYRQKKLGSFILGKLKDVKVRK